MDFITPVKDMSELKKLFTAPKNEYKPVPFYHMDGDIQNDEEIASQLSGYKKSGYGGLALLPVSETVPAYGTPEYYDAYGRLLDRLRKNSMSAIYYDDMDFPSGWAGGELAEKFPQSLAKTLVMLEYSCTSGEHAEHKLDSDGTLMAICAYEIDENEIIDLRQFVDNEKHMVVWDVPAGNWDILQFVCKTEKDTKYVNYLSYEACQNFISLTYKRFTDRFEDFIGDTVGMTFYDDIQFRVHNRRMWDDSFNDEFERRFGFDPAPYYPALFMNIGENTAHIKALMFNCRSQMMCSGFFKAVADFTSAHGLCCTGHVAEAKTILSPWLFGDGMLYQRNAGACGLDLIHSYGYGFNALKLVSSSAYNFDKPLVACEIYGNYARLTEKILYKAAMNAFVRGANYFIPHTLWYSGHARIPHEVSHRSEFKDIIGDLNSFITRAQTLLRGGRHVCDIALLYPVHSLESQTNLFSDSETGFEFPSPPPNADFMNVINSLLNYCGHDVTVLHPETLAEKCYVEDDTIKLSNKENFEQFKILIIPSMSMITLAGARMIEKFFIGGGRIIATGELPSKAFEYSPGKTDNDAEINRIIQNVFGVTAAEVNSFTDFYENHSDNGGSAYFILPTLTAADGTDMVDSEMLDNILSSLDVAFDTVVQDFPHVHDNGILSLALPAFLAMNAQRGMRSGGVFNYLHRKLAGCDIWYFSNSTNTDYSGEISLRGHFSAEEWNPYNGKTRRITSRSDVIKGETYTTIESEIPSGTSIFYVCRDIAADKNKTVELI